MTEEEVLERFNQFDDNIQQLVSSILPHHAEGGAPLEEGVSETEESDSKRTSERSRDRKREEESPMP